jgi:hypothetical protein
MRLHIPFFSHLAAFGVCCGFDLVSHELTDDRQA